MQVLLTAATPFEIAPTIEWLEQGFEQREQGCFSSGALKLQICVTGVGMLATAWQLSQLFVRHQPAFCINAGIAGALDPALKIGDVVNVGSEILADLGVEDAAGRFIDLFELGFSAKDNFPFVAGRLQNPEAANSQFLPLVQGITVNKAHGAAGSIAKIREKYPEAQVESMEGAAFFFACLHAGLPFVELRAISNYVEPRNREGWDLPLAIQNLNRVLQEMLKGLV
jgi:futalosine hydrolase